MSDDIRDDELLGVFELPTDPLGPAEISANLISFEPEHKHLADLSFLWLFRNTEQKQGGRRVIGMVHKPEVQGKLRPLFEQMIVATYGYMPDYIVTVDSEWWGEASAQQREALVFHELCHVKQATDSYGDPRYNAQTGEPIFELVAHDLEEFNSVVQRFGAWKTDIKSFIDAAREGGALAPVSRETSTKV